MDAVVNRCHIMTPHESIKDKHADWHICGQTPKNAGNNTTYLETMDAHTEFMANPNKEIGHITTGKDRALTLFLLEETVSEINNLLPN